MDPLTKLENQMQHEMYKQIRLYFSATGIALNQGWGWQHNRIDKVLKETQKAWNECGKDNSKSMVELLEDETGVELQNGSGKSWREYAFLNNSHPLTNSEDLDESSQIRLSILLQSFPAFQEPHAIKEKFREIYLFSKNRSEAEQAFEEWKTTINDYPEYLAFADTVENWRTEIFNYFDFRFTNAVTESLNKVSKEISAQGRGYNFNVLRAKLLYRNEAAKPAKFAYHEPQRPSTGVMQDMTFTFMTPFFGKKKSVEVGAGTDIDVLSEQISDIVEIRQRLGRINRYANKFKFWDEPKEDKE